MNFLELDSISPDYPLSGRNVRRFKKVGRLHYTHTGPVIYAGAKPACWKGQREVLDGVYRRTEGEPDFQEARAPTRAELEGVLEKIITRRVRMLTRLGDLVEEQGMSYLADLDPDNRERPLSGSPKVSCGCAPLCRALHNDP